MPRSRPRASTPTEIDLLVLATTTPDQTVPATASSVQHELGLQCGAFDLNAACSGFVYALVAAHGFIGAGADKVLVDRFRDVVAHRRLGGPGHRDPVR